MSACLKNFSSATPDLKTCFTNVSVSWKNFYSAASVNTYPAKVVYLKICFTNVSASLKNFCSGASVNASALVGVRLAVLLGLVCLDPAGEGGRPRRTKWRNRPPRKFPLKWEKTTRQRHKKYQGRVVQSVIKPTQDQWESRQFCHFSVRFYVCIVCPSILSLTNLNLHKTKAVKKHLILS